MGNKNLFALQQRVEGSGRAGGALRHTFTLLTVRLRLNGSGEYKSTREDGGKN